MVPSDDLVRQLHRRAGADRWLVPLPAFRAALEAAAAARAPASPRDLERFLSSLHLEDLALACACAAGHEEAWDHFVREHRPVLYRAADALDPGGGARDLADAIYADLYGLRERDGRRQSLFQYFHGRSSLATWLRAVLAQRHVDRARAERRLAPLPEDDEAAAPAAPAASDPDHARYVELMRQALYHALAALLPRDRLRLASYHVQGLTLAETGRVLREHEATASRALARTRRALRESIEEYLARDAKLDPDELRRCIRSVADDSGALDLGRLLQPERRKISTPDRSRDREPV